jgi:hypothetical protein
MKKRVASGVLVSAMGLGSVGSLAISPSWAETATTATNDRVSRIASALKGLVSDGTITQAQADKVASTLAATLPDPGPGGPGHGGGRMMLESAATILGMSVDDLRTALESGKSLVDVARTKGISRATLISRLVAAAEARLAQDVKDGRLTKAEANQRKAGLKARITEMVDRKGLPARPGPPPAAPGSSSSSNPPTSTT